MLLIAWTPSCSGPGGWIVEGGVGAVVVEEAVYARGVVIIANHLANIVYSYGTKSIPKVADGSSRVVKVPLL